MKPDKQEVVRENLYASIFCDYCGVKQPGGANFCPNCGKHVTGIDQTSTGSELITSGTVPLYRYWNAGITDHFYTTNWSELGNGKSGWAYEGVQCKIFKYLQPGTVPLHRYWSGKDHFYTTSVTEIGTTVPGTKGRHGYTSEGVAGCGYPNHIAGAIPLYRYWKSNGADHFYTTDVNEIGTHAKGQVGRHGYQDEGVACYVFPT